MSRNGTRFHHNGDDPVVRRRGGRHDLGGRAQVVRGGARGSGIEAESRGRGPSSRLVRSGGGGRRQRAAQLLLHAREVVSLSDDLVRSCRFKACAILCSASVPAAPLEPRRHSLTSVGEKAAKMRKRKKQSLSMDKANLKEVDYGKKEASRSPWGKVRISQLVWAKSNQPHCLFIPDERHDQHEAGFTEEGADSTADPTSSAESVPEEPLAGRWPQTVSHAPREGAGRLLWDVISKGNQWYTHSKLNHGLLEKGINKLTETPTQPIGGARRKEYKQKLPVEVTTAAAGAARPRPQLTLTMASGHEVGLRSPPPPPPLARSPALPPVPPPSCATSGASLAFISYRERASSKCENNVRKSLQM